MSKDTFYFSHDYNARSDPKLKAVLMKHKAEGLGVYWCIIEMLYEQGGYIPLSCIESIAYELHSECDRITSVLRDFDLFKFDEKQFYSESVLRRLEERIEKSNKARQSAYNRWNDANVLRTQSKGNAKKERKGKKIKENNNIIQFSIFWDSYHQITGLKKTDFADAEKYWKRLTQKEQQKAIDNIKPYFDSLNDKKYCKKARTYLSDKNFNDEFKIVPKLAEFDENGRKILRDTEGWGRRIDD